STAGDGMAAVGPKVHELGARVSPANPSVRAAGDELMKRGVGFDLVAELFQARDRQAEPDRLAADLIDQELDRGEHLVRHRTDPGWEKPNDAGQPLGELLLVHRLLR